DRPVPRERAGLSGAGRSVPRRFLGAGAARPAHRAAQPPSARQDAARGAAAPGADRPQGQYRQGGGADAAAPGLSRRLLRRRDRLRPGRHGLTLALPGPTNPTVPATTKPVRRPTKAEQRAETMEQIFDAAEYLFSKHGFYGVTLKEVAQRVGVHHTLLNYYF